MRGNNTKSSTKIIGTILICVMVLLLAILIIQFTNLINLKNKQKQLEASYKKTQEQIEEYDELLDYIDYSNGKYNQDFLEKYAREVYGWGKSNRKYYTQG